MEFSYNDLGSLKGGEIVEVTISGNGPNVLLVDSSNFSAFKSGRRYTFYGGQATRSPVRLPVPRSGHWYLVVHFGGLQGRSRYSVQVLPGALPAIRERPLPSLKTIGDNVASMRDDQEPGEQAWDVFVSHAAEDKDEIVRPLAVALKSLGLSVWYDDFELRLGDSLRRKIDAGLAKSRFGVVVLSPSFFAKNWPQYELDGLVSREMNGEQVILPLWHKVTKAEVISYSPSLADKVARNTVDATVQEIAQEIAEMVGRSRSNP
jgi:hypothetical protein